MKDSIKQYLSELNKNKSRRRKLLGVFCVLAIMVAAGVSWHLRIIGITKTAEPTCKIVEHVHSEECILSKTLICGFEDDIPDEPSKTEGGLALACPVRPHVHAPECFDTLGNPICGNADYIIHQHNSFCFDEIGALICTLPEILPHIHTEACYEEATTWLCGLAEGENTAAHTHTEDCYEAASVLTCELPEDETHSHAPECYTEERQLVCAIPETEAHIHGESCEQVSERRLICGLAEIIPHTHIPECYDEFGIPVCGQLQVPEHMHTFECVAVSAQEEAAENGIPAVLPLADFSANTEWNCAYLSHVHAPECFDAFGSQICGNADYIIHQHNSFCFDETGVLICTLPEILPHIHTEACYEEATTWLCGYQEGEETAAHTHTDDCYETQSVLTCELPEDETHSHAPECYVEERQLVCTLPETEAHIHSESCEQTTETSLACGLKEVIPHTHIPECYDLMGGVICGQLQVPEHMHTAECLEQSAPDALPEDNADPADGITEIEQEEHVHTDECYEIIYGCGFAEHVHGIMCYADYNADLETDEDWLATIPPKEGFEGTRSEYLVEIANSQLGYAESKRNYVIDDQGVRRGYSRYGQWYNNQYGPWNTSFVSFCMHYAGIFEDEIPPASGALQMYVQLDSLGRFVPHSYNDPMGDYEPVPGDIIFTDINGDGIPDRTGIVCEVIGDRIEVIEGDVGDSDYISGEDPGLYEGIGGPAVSLLGLASSDDIYIDEAGELDGMPIDLLSGDYPAFDTAAPMSEDPGYMEAPGVNPDGTIADPTADPALGIPEAPEENVVLDGYEPLGYVWDDEDIPTHSVAKVSYEKSDSAIVGYGIVSDGEEAEEYTYLGGHVKYNGPYWDLGNYSKVAIVNVNNGSYNSVSVQHDYYTAKSVVFNSANQNDMWTLTDVDWQDQSFLLKGSKGYLSLDSEKNHEIRYAERIDGSDNLHYMPNMKFEPTNDNRFKIKEFNAGKYLAYDNANGKFKAVEKAEDATEFMLYSSRNKNAVVTVSNDTIKSSKTDNVVTHSTIAGEHGTPYYLVEATTAEVDNRKVLSAKGTEIYNTDHKNFEPSNDGIHPSSSNQLIWKLSQFDITNNGVVTKPAKDHPFDYRFQLVDGVQYLHISNQPGKDVVENASLTKADENWGSKFRLFFNDDYTLINSLNGSSNEVTKYYLAYENEKFVYKYFETEADARNSPYTHFQLYVPKTENIDERGYAHIYELGTLFSQYGNGWGQLPVDANVPDKADKHNAKIMKLYAQPGEKLLLKIGNAGFNLNSAGDNFRSHITDANVADIDFLDSNWRSLYAVTAKKEGKSVITLWQENVEEADWQGEVHQGRYILQIEVQVGGNIEDTFHGHDYPYRHLDVEVDADFDIYVYNENYDPNNPTAFPEYTVIKPEADTIKVVNVYAKVYNTAALLTGEKQAIWNSAYVSNPGGYEASGSLKSWKPTDTVDVYTNPWKKIREVESTDPVTGKKKWQYTKTDDLRYGDFKFGMDPPDDYGNSNPTFSHGGYVEHDTYNGQDVQSVVITYNKAATQENGQLEFLTYGWGWTELYDGDTAELHCTIQYKYKDKTYKADYVVNRLICDTNNICPSAFDYGIQQHGFDIDVIIDDIIEVESNELVKVDQYGNGIPGAEFDFYPTGADYNTVGVQPVAALHAVTDENGRFQFIETRHDSSGRPQTAIMSLRKIKELLGGKDHFVMREVSAPPGYRSIPQDAHLYFEGSADGKELFVRSANAFESGVIANGDANVIAPQILHMPGSSPGIVGTEVPYYSINSQTGDFTFYGDLYAVVLKRNGANKGATDVSQLDLSQWSPVYGDDMEGYTVEKPQNGQIAADIVKRLISENKGVYKFEPNITGRFCSASVSQLPGNLTRYYTYLYNMSNNKTLTADQVKNDLEYIVSYYFVPQGKYDTDGMPTEIYRINSHDVGNNPDNEFKIHWATTIEAPNFTNNLYFQKVNAEGALLNDAYFALYNAAEITPAGSNTPITCIESYGSYYDLKPPTISNQGRYEGTAVQYDINGNVQNSNCRYTINCNQENSSYEHNGMVDKPFIGQIQVFPNSTSTDPIAYISPVHRTDDVSKSFVGYTHSAHETEGGDPLDCITASAAGGTGHFVRLPKGNYILMEIKPPPGYEINPTKVKVAVTDKGVFANAGTFDDGVIVAKGVGYLAKTMTSFASKGNINESLTWIAAHLNVNESNLYSALEDKTDANWKFAAPGNENYKGKTNRAYRAFYRGRDYAVADSSIYRENSMVTYLLYDPQSQNYVDQTGTVTINRKLFQYAVNFGEHPPAEGVAPTDDHYTAGQFARERKTVTLNGENIEIRPTAKGTGTLRLYTDIGWSFLSVFQDSGYALQPGIRNPTSLYNDLTTSNERLQYLFSNATYVQLTDPISIGLTVVKEGKDPDDPENEELNIPLEGAEFRIYKTVEGKQYFYKLKDGVTQGTVKDSSDVEWTIDEKQATPLISESKTINGKEVALFRVHGLAEGTYYLEETKAPDGYTCATPQKISIEVVNGRFVLKFNDKDQTVLASGAPLYDNSHTVQIQQYAVTVVDVNDLQINIRKVDKTNLDTLLADAKFVLYRYVTPEGGGAQKIEYYDSYTNGVVAWTETESEALELTSTSTEPMKISGLTEGTYYLKETKAPPGYYALTSDIEITVTETEKGNLTVSAKYESGDMVACQKVDSTDNKVAIYEITVPNTTGYALPETGGIGTQIYTFSGIILMLAAAVLFVIKKPLVTECVRRRRERRTER